MDKYTLNELKRQEDAMAYFYGVFQEKDAIIKHFMESRIPLHLAVPITKGIIILENIQECLLAIEYYVEFVARTRNELVGSK